MKERLKKNSGITLIALIITIIVMLILVAVTVNIANDNGNGLFGRARSAKVDTAYRAEQENLLMYMYGEDYDAATGVLNLEKVKEKLEADNATSKRWESITLNETKTELIVVGTQSGKTHTISSTETTDEKDGDETTTSLYEGKVWGQYLTTEQLKELGFTEDEIATREDAITYVAKVDLNLMDNGNKANNIEEAKQILGEDIWADNTSIFTFGIKNSKFILAGRADQEFIVQFDIKKITKTKIVMDMNDADCAIFISEDGNTVYFPMYGS